MDSLMNEKPTIGDHTTLNITLNALFGNNTLKNWSLFDDLKSGIVTLKLRFTKLDTTSAVQSQSFRRKSGGQIQRDCEIAERHRARKHTMATMSLDVAEADISQDITCEGEELSGSETIPTLNYTPVVDCDLNPGAACFIPQLADRDSTDYQNTCDIKSDQCSENLSGDIEQNLIEIVDYSHDLTATNSSKSLNSRRKTREVCVGKLTKKDKDSRCHRCFISDEVAKHVDFIKMFYCSQCKVNICENCFIGTNGKRRIEKHDKHKGKVKEH